MDPLSPPLRIAVCSLLGLYLGWVSLDSLMGGVFRYKGRSHARAEEPKTFWMGVLWFGLLGIVMLGYAAMTAVRSFGGTE